MEMCCLLYTSVINLGTSVLCSQYLGARLHKQVVQVVANQHGPYVRGHTRVTMVGTEATSIGHEKKYNPVASYL